MADFTSEQELTPSTPLVGGPAGVAAPPLAALLFRACLDTFRRSARAAIQL